MVAFTTAANCYSEQKLREVLYTSVQLLTNMWYSTLQVTGTVLHALTVYIVGIFKTSQLTDGMYGTPHFNYVMGVAWVWHRVCGHVITGNKHVAVAQSWWEATETQIL